MSSQESIDPAWFRQVLGQFPTGVTVVTAMSADGRPEGMAVGSFTSVSLNPPLVAFFPDKSSTTWPKLAPTRSFCVNVLSADQEDVCRLFATKGIDRFAQFPWRGAPSGSPILDGAVAWIDCDIESITEAGDHFIVLGRVRDLNIGSETLPLLFYRGGYGRFEPLSLAVAAGNLLGSLRLVDLARPEMEAIAEEFGVQCVATSAVGGELVVLASAGEPMLGPAVPVGHRVPFVPPLGTVFTAWAGADMQRAWESSFAADLSPQQHDLCQALLRRVRQRQFSVATGASWHRDLLYTNEALAKQPKDPELLERRRALISSLLEAYEPETLVEEVANDVRSVNVPVFDNEGVAFMLSVFGLPERVGGNSVGVYARRLQTTAKRLTGVLGGTWPPLEVVATSPKVAAAG